MLPSATWRFFVRWCSHALLRCGWLCISVRVPHSPRCCCWAERSVVCPPPHHHVTTILAERVTERERWQQKERNTKRRRGSELGEETDHAWLAAAEMHRSLPIIIISFRWFSSPSPLCLAVSSLFAFLSLFQMLAVLFECVQLSVRYLAHYRGRTAAAWEDRYIHSLIHSSVCLVSVICLCLCGDVRACVCVCVRVRAWVICISECFSLFMRMFDVFLLVLPFPSLSSSFSLPFQGIFVVFLWVGLLLLCSFHLTPSLLPLFLVGWPFIVITRMSVCCCMAALSCRPGSRAVERSWHGGRFMHEYWGRWMMMMTTTRRMRMWRKERE